MKKFFSFTFAFLLMVSMISLVGCNGLWDFDDDDDVTLTPINFKVGGNVTVPTNTPSPNLRAQIKAEDLEIAAYKFDPDTGSESKILESVTGVASDGSFIVEFSDYGGYFILQTGTSNDKMKLSLYLEGLSRGDSERDAVIVNATSTAQVLLLEQAYMNTGKIISLSDLDSTDVDTVAGIVNTTLSTDDIDNVIVAVNATSISITNKSAISSMVVGDKETLTATIEPSYATVSWTSSDTSVASITDGVLTALAEGTTTVTVSDGQGTSDSVTVTVSAAKVDVEGVTLNKPSTSIAEGASETLTATVAPSNATNKNVTWKSSDDSVATVDSTGKVTGVSAGNATITVTTADGGYTATCAVTVTEVATGVMSVTFDSAVSGQDTASIQIVIRNVDYTTYTNSVDITYTQSGTNKTATFAKDTTLSNQFQEVTLAPEDGSLTSTPYAIPDFQTLSFSQEVPFGATVAVYDLNNNTDLVTYTVPNP